MTVAQITERLHWRVRDRDDRGLLALLKTWRRRA